VPKSRSFSHVALLVLVVLTSVMAARAEASPPTFDSPPATLNFQAGDAPKWLIVRVLPGQEPNDSNLRVWLDLTPFGGPARALFVDQGFVCNDDTRDFAFYACFTYRSTRRLARAI